jgi:hypothetical protein
MSTALPPERSKSSRGSYCNRMWAWFGGTRTTTKATRQYYCNNDETEIEISADDIEVVGKSAANVEDLADSPLYVAANHYHKNNMIALLKSKRGYDMTRLRMRDSGRYFLHIFAKTVTLMDAIAVTDAYLAAGGDLNCQDFNGDTPLALACMAGNVHTMTTLLERGADPNIPNTRGDTPMHKACFEKNSKTLQILLKYKGSAESIDMNGRSLLHYCCSIGASELIPVLIEHGANINNCDKWMRTPLMTAARNQRHACVKLLLDEGCCCAVDDVDSFGCNAARCALMCIHYKPTLVHDDIMMMLVRKGIDIYSVAKVISLILILQLVWSRRLSFVGWRERCISSQTKVRCTHGASNRGERHSIPFCLLQS